MWRFFFIIWLFVGCDLTKKINPKLNASANKIVLDAALYQVTQAPGDPTLLYPQNYLQVVISRTVVSGGVPSLVDNAVVELLNANGALIETVDWNKQTGNYNVFLEAGSILPTQSYTLRVTLSNGDVYKATGQMPVANTTVRDFKYVDYKNTQVLAFDIDYQAGLYNKVLTTFEPFDQSQDPIISQNFSEQVLIPSVNEASFQPGVYPVLLPDYTRSDQQASKSLFIALLTMYRQDYLYFSDVQKSLQSSLFSSPFNPRTNWQREATTALAVLGNFSVIAIYQITYRP